LTFANFFMERMKSFSLYRDLYQYPQQQPNNTHSFFEKEKEIRATLTQLKWKRFFEAVQKDHAMLNKKIDQQLDQLEQLYQTYQRDFPMHYAAKMQLDFKPIETSLSLLRQPKHQSKTIVQFAQTKDALFTLLLRKDTCIFLKTPKDDLFNNNVLEFQEQLSQSHLIGVDSFYQEFTQRSHQLYQKLWAPIAPFLPRASQIILIPDGALSQLPFEVLIRQSPTKDTKINYKKLDYLVKEWTIEYATSLKTYLYKTQNQSPLPSSPKILAFADAKNSQSKKGIFALRDSSLSRLPGSERELLAIQQLYGTKENHFFFGEESNQKNFRRYSQQAFDILHLALHAKADETHWLKSKLYLRQAQSKASKNNRHDPILGHELSNLNLSIPLVVLSACQTAKGIEFVGEGTQSLARAFLKAGTGKVISSFWNINDHTTSELISYFYHHLKASHNITTALTKAKLDYLNKKDDYLSFPGFWAALICLN
ncbi:MAG: CHAT domain-containing protein, partial [Bacteroidota bacterium]